MIASHNTYTCFRPRYKFFNLFKWLWKCQDWEYDGTDVTMIDIRVRKDKRGRIWYCHGIVDLYKPFIDEQSFIEDIAEWLVLFPMCRIINEQGGDGLWLLDIYNQLDKDTQRKIVQIINKKDWSYILAKSCPWEKDVDCFQKYRNPKNNIWQNIKHLAYSICHGLTLKKYARLHPVTQEQIDDKTTMYWHDFV